MAIFRGAFEGSQDGELGQGKRPVVFDILGPDYETSLLPDDLKLVLHVNPSSMKFSYAKIINRVQTKGGFVEQHFGDGAESIAFEFASGAFMRLYTGLISITGGTTALDVGGTRRETLAYDSYLDLLGLFHNNGSVYDARGNIVFQGILKVSFDGDYWLGWFDTFSVDETAEKPYQFSMTADFQVYREFMGLRTWSMQTAGMNPAGDDTGETGDDYTTPAQKLETKKQEEAEAASLELSPLGEILDETVAPLVADTRASLGWITE